MSEFGPLMELNPRSMKRLTNIYTFHEMLAVLARVDFDRLPVRRRQLALWTIVRLRWPLLAENLEINPDLAEELCRDSDHEQIVPVELENVFRAEQIPSIRRVFNGKAVGTKLTSEAVNYLSPITSTGARAAW